MDAVAVPVSLIVLALISCADLYRHNQQTRHGAIKLPQDADDDVGAGSSEQLGWSRNGFGGSRSSNNGQIGDDDESIAELEDPGDEGDFVDEETFWLKTRLRKAALVLVLAVLDAIACVELGWDSSRGAKDRYGISEDALMAAFWVCANHGRR